MDVLELKNIIEPGLREIQAGVQTLTAKQAGLEQQVGAIDPRLKAIEKGHNDLMVDVSAIKKHQARSVALRQTKPGYVSNECAGWLGAKVILAAVALGKFAGMEAHQRDALCGASREILGIESKAAITTSDMPVPTEYAGEVAELVWQYGQARQYATVYPLGALTTNLPRLGTDPAFGFIDASATVTEKSPQYAHVAFDAKKAGGLVRLPSEIDADAIVPIGQFLARYGARQTAKWEDTTLFVADGSATYKTLKGVTKEVVDQSKVETLAGGSTAISQSTLAKFRATRARVDSAALGVGAYYLHPTMEQHLCTFNSSGDTPYIANGVRGAMLDGFPIRWVDVLPPYSTSADVSKVFAVFGDLSFWYLGIRAGYQLDVSRDVFFATDELAIRFLERFTIGMMAIGAMSGLRTAAA